MTFVQQYIASGILEAYLHGELDDTRQHEVEQVIQRHEEVRHHLDRLSVRLEEKLRAQAIAPPRALRAVILATADYLDRMSKGEPPAFPPSLHKGSRASDYHQWLDRIDFQHPAEVEDIVAKIISHTPDSTIAVVWMKEMLQETHYREIERFLIIEGTCTVYMDDVSYDLKPGDLMTIPLLQTHRAVATSGKPCKVILQRIAV